MKYLPHFKKKYPKLAILVFSLILLVAVATSCLGGTSSQTVQAGGQGTLNLTNDGPITLDPALAAEAGSGAYILQIFSGLMRLDDNLQVTGDIAQTWDRSTDGTIFTFHLRHDVKFHDGRQVTAGDFKYSWERALNPATQSTTAGTYLNDIMGAADMLSGKASSLSGIKVIDDYTLRVTIDAPKPYFLEKMAFPTAFVVDRANVESGGQWWQHPNGTGPFKLQQWQAGQQLVLKRNDNYYGDRALLSQVVFHLLAGSPIQLYQQGTIDVAFISANFLGLATDPKNVASKELNIYPEFSFYYLGFNASTPPFDDAKVRQAFCHAVDKEKITTLAAMNAVTTANGILPLGMPGYSANMTGLSYDPQKAKELIRATKYGDVSKLPPIVLTTYGYGGDISGVLGGVIEQWRQNLGVEVTVRQLETENFLYSLKQEANQIFDSSWIADYPDPQDFLDILFHSGQQNNFGGYSNPQLDYLLDRAAVEQDPNTRLQMYQQAEQITLQDAAVLPLSFGRAYVLVKPYVKGYALSPLGYPQLNRVSVQK